MGRLKRKFKKGSRLVVELADTQERVVITLEHIREKSCDVLLQSTGNVRIYPLPANDETDYGRAGQ
jgi:hypothetical protein